MDCPDCGATVRGVTTRGPSEHFLDPCGCRVSELTAREFGGGVDHGRGLATDGGQEMTEWECGGCGDVFESPGEPELACLLCGADDWQEVDAE